MAELTYYSGFDTLRNQPYIETAEIVDKLPEIGDEIDGWIVDDVYPAKLGATQPSRDVYSYEIVHVAMIYDDLGLYVIDDYARLRPENNEED